MVLGYDEETLATATSLGFYMKQMGPEGMNKLAPVLYKKNGVLALVLTTRCLRMATGRDRYSRARKSEGCRLRGTLRIVKTT